MTIEEYTQNLGKLCELCNQEDSEALDAYYKLIFDQEGYSKITKNMLKDSHDTLKELAVRRNKYAETLYARCIEVGVGRIKDDENQAESRRYYLSAALAGERFAQCQIGKRYKEEKGFEKDLVQYYLWVKRSAEAGLIVSQNYLGAMYYNGDGTEKNYTEAAKWFQTAAQEGNKAACHNIALCSQRGNGVTQDYEKAAYYYLKAADLGHEKSKEVIETTKEIWAGLSKLYYSGRGEYNKDYEKALHYAEKAADAGLEDGMRVLAYCYELGRGGKQNDILATLYYLCALNCTKNNQEEIRHELYDSENVGMYYFAGKLFAHGGEAENYLQSIEVEASYIDFYKKYGWHTVDLQEAVKLYRMGAEDGLSYCMMELAKCYETGKGVKKDSALAAMWYQKSEEAGNEHAKEKIAKSASLRSDIAVNYYNGINGYEKNYEKALQLFTANALQGEVVDIYNMGYICSDEKVCKYRPAYTALYYEIALRFRTLKEDLKKAIEEDISKYNYLQYYLGIIYLKGPDAGQLIKEYPIDGDAKYKKMIEQNITALWEKYPLTKAYPNVGMDYLKKAVDAGNVKALVYFGDIYRDGIGVERDLETAASYYLRAKRKGNKEAENNLTTSGRLAYYAGEACYYGKGVDQNYESAIYWYEIANEKNDNSGTYSLGFCYANGKGTEQNQGKAIAYFLIAAKRGHVPSMCEVGAFYYKESITDFGPTLNRQRMISEDILEKALLWYQKAADQGSKDGMYGLGRCYDLKPKGMFKDTKAAVWYMKAAREGHKEAIRICKERNLRY